MTNAERDSSSSGAAHLAISIDRRRPSLDNVLNYLATRFTCSWPWTTWCCSATGGSSAAAPIRTGSASLATRARPASPASGPGEVASSLRRESTPGGSRFCGDCPLKLPLKKDEAPPAAIARRRAAAEPAVRRVHGRLQHLLQPGVLRARDRASRARARPACSTSICSRG